MPRSSGRRLRLELGLSPIEREGVRALYNSAPFKLLRSEPPNFYSIPIAPIEYLETNRKIKWRSAAVKDTFDIDIYAHNTTITKRAVHPYTLFSYRFCPRKGGFIFQFLSKRESFPRFPPAYIEYSYDALINGYYCRLGWVLLSSKRICPIQTDCPYYRPIEEQKSPCRHYSGSTLGARPVAYSSMYTVYPIIRRIFISRKTGDPIFGVRLGDKPLAIARFLEDCEVRYYVDTIEFAPRNIVMYRRPIVFLREPIGIRLLGIRAIELEFFPEHLRKFVNDLLVRDTSLTKWVLLKYELFKDKGGELRENMGYQAFDRMLESMVKKIDEEGLDGFQKTQLYRKLIKPDLSDEEFLGFTEFVLLHSLSHIFKHALETYVGCDPDDLQYFVEHPKNPSIRPRSESIRLVIFENAVGGLGYLKTLAQAIKTDPEEYRNFVQHLVYIVESYREHLLRMVGQRGVMKANLTQFRPNHAHLVDTIERVYDIAQQLNVYPHVNSIREILASKVISEADRTRLDDILSYVPLCWDGCQLCVILEHGCIFNSYDQPFLVSLHLSIKGFETIVSSLEDPRQLVHFVRGIKETFYNFIRAARSHIYIATPWISKNVINELFHKAEAGVEIRLLLSDDTSNKIHSESLNYLKQFVIKHPKVEVRLLPISEFFLHAKGVMVDDCMLMEGSFNLTNRGLEENVENLTVSFSPHDARDFYRGFIREWNKAKRLTT